MRSQPKLRACQPTPSGSLELYLSAHWASYIVRAYVRQACVFCTVQNSSLVPSPPPPPPPHSSSPPPNEALNR